MRELGKHLDKSQKGSDWHGAFRTLGRVSGRRRHQRPKLLSLRKLRNHLQFGGSPYCPASQRTKAVKATIKNCPKVRSRRTISLVLFTNRPRCCAWATSKPKISFRLIKGPAPPSPPRSRPSI